jgi:hypothetical protein
MAESAPPTSTPPRSPKNDWARTSLWIFIIGIVAVNAALFVRSCQKLPGETIDKTARVIAQAGRALSDVAAAFTQGRVTTEFISYATTVSNQHYLQFATLRQKEIFTRTEETTTAFGYVPLPEVVVEARAPVDYTYYLDLSGKWDILLRDGVVHVSAPSIRFNKPAVDVSAITYEVKKGYLKTAEAQENLKKSITSLSVLRARENIPLIRETARRQTVEFVERWLMKSFTDGKDYPVKVYFPGEKTPDAIPFGDVPSTTK